MTKTPTPADDLGFRVVARKNGEVEVRRGAVLAAVLRGAPAAALLAAAPTLTPAQLQQRLARLTGNYKRGNERAAAKQGRSAR